MEVGSFGCTGGVVMVAVRHTDPYAAQESERYAARLEVDKYTVCVSMGSS